MWTILPLIATSAASGTPGPVTSLNAGEIFSFAFSALDLGVAGLMLLLFIQGKLHSSDELDHEREARREELAHEREARKKAEDQRDEALRVATDQVVPLLTTFNASVSALLPILQGIVHTQEEARHHDEHRRR